MVSIKVKKIRAAVSPIVGEKSFFPIRKTSKPVKIVISIPGRRRENSHHPPKDPLIAKSQRCKGGLSAQKSLLKYGERNSLLETISLATPEYSPSVMEVNSNVPRNGRK